MNTSSIMTLGNCSPISINSAGQVLLEFNLNSSNLPVGPVNVELWQDGNLKNIGTFDGSDWSFHMNDSGVVVGNNNTGTISSFVWQNGATTTLPSVSIGSFSYLVLATAIDDGGDVYGYSELTPGVSYTDNQPIAPDFVYQNGVMTILNANIQSIPIIIEGSNANGDLIGNGSAPLGSVAPAILWKNGTATNLGVTGSQYIAVDAFAINNSDQITGKEQTAYGLSTTTAFVWQNGRMTELAPLVSGYQYNQALAINDQGLIVGTSGASLGSPIAVLWQNGSPINLNSLLPADSGWVLMSATGINDNNQIVGAGTHDGVSAGFVMTITTPTISASVAVGQYQQGAMSSITPIADTAEDILSNLNGLARLMHDTSRQSGFSAIF
jgi:probable HAF family extracellular repeat protein